MTNHYRLKLFLNNVIQRATDFFINIVSIATTPENVYLRIFRCINIFYPIFSLIYKKTRPQAHHPTFRLQFFKIVMASLQRKFCGYKINIEIDENNSLVQAIKRGQTPIILAPHLRITTILGYYLAQEKIELAVLANTDPNKAYLNFGMNKTLKFIQADLSCLFKIRECLNANTPVLVMPDFERGQSKMMLKKFISPSVFSFATRFQYPVFFMWVDFNHRGQIRLKFEKPVNANEDGLINEFIHFIQQRTPWQVICQHPKN